MVCCMAAMPVPSDSPSGRLNEKVVATKGPWWLIASGVVLGPKLLKAASGTEVSTVVAIEAPVEAPPRPLLASWLSARFCAADAGASEPVAALLLLPVVVPFVLLLE